MTLTINELRILVAIRSLQPTTIRRVATHLGVSHTWLLHHLYNSFPRQVGTIPRGLIDNGYVISTGKNTLRLTPTGRNTLSGIGYLVDSRGVYKIVKKYE